MYELLTDIVRALHFLSLAVGIGAAVFLEGLVLQRARVSIEEEEIALIEHGHRLILGALAALWVTGIALIGLKTGFEFAALTSKVTTKMWIVGALTANAFVIAWVATPLLKNAMYSSLSDMPDFEVAVIGGAAGLSAAGWLSALLLGAVSAFAAVPADLLGICFAAVLVIGGLIGAGVTVHISHMAPGEPLIGKDMIQLLFPKRRRKRTAEELFIRIPPAPGDVKQM